MLSLLVFKRVLSTHFASLFRSGRVFSLSWAFIILAEIIMWIVSRWLWKLKPPWNHFVIELSEKGIWIIGVKWPSIYLCVLTSLRVPFCCVKSQKLIFHRLMNFCKNKTSLFGHFFGLCWANCYRYISFRKHLHK